MPIISTSLIESIKRAVIAALVVIVTIALSGCGGSAQELANRTQPNSPITPHDWEPPNRPNTPQQDIVVSGITCTGIFPCRDQFASIVANKGAAGDITLNNYETYVLDDSRSANIQNAGHNELVGAVIEQYGSGALVNYSTSSRRPQDKSVALRRIPTTYPVIVNHSIYEAYQSDGFAFDHFGKRQMLLVQTTGNVSQLDANHCHNHDCWSIHEKIAQTGRLIMVTGHYGAGTRIIGRPYFSKCGGVEQYCISAKGVNVPVILKGKHEFSRGTSVAAPLVTSALQLLSAMWPYLSQEELVQLVLALAEDQGEAGVDEVWGHGILSFRKLFTQQGLMGFKSNMVACVDTNSYS